MLFKKQQDVFKYLELNVGSSRNVESDVSLEPDLRFQLWLELSRVLGSNI